MSFSTPRAKIIAIMESLKYKLVKDAFDFESIGNTKIDLGFHVEQGTITSEAQNQQTTAVLNPMTLRFWQKGKKDTNVTMTNMLLQLDLVMNNIMAVQNRTDGVRNIVFDEFAAVPHSDQNDDIIRGELTITYNQEFCFTTP